jgi:hypothetical protein
MGSDMPLCLKIRVDVSHCGVMGSIEQIPGMQTVPQVDEVGIENVQLTIVTDVFGPPRVIHARYLGAVGSKLSREAEQTTDLV